MVCDDSTTTKNAQVLIGVKQSIVFKELSVKLITHYVVRDRAFPGEIRVYDQLVSGLAKRDSFNSLTDLVNAYSNKPLVSLSFDIPIYTRDIVHLQDFEVETYHCLRSLK